MMLAFKPWMAKRWVPYGSPERASCQHVWFDDKGTCFCLHRTPCCVSIASSLMETKTTDGTTLSRSSSKVELGSCPVVSPISPDGYILPHSVFMEACGVYSAKLLNAFLIRRPAPRPRHARDFYPGVGKR